MADMWNSARGDVCKVWLYAAASVALGAWIAPLPYNAGKALAEVSLSKSTNGPLDWLARHCRVAEFPEFYLISLAAAALVLFLPWLEWLSGRRGAVGRGPWRLRVPAGSCAYGQVLEVNPRGLWHGCAGFLIAAGLLLSMGVALVPAGFTTLRQPPDGLMSLAMRVLVPALAAAALMEVFFRGVAMGIFLRAMRPSAALGMSAAFFALVLAVVPPAGLDVADPEAPGIGFELLRKTLARFADGSVVAAELLPVLALGCVLAYARWRSASLWLPVGLHTGWLFAKRMLAELYPAGGPADADHSLRLMQQGLLPLTAILLAGVLAHYFTAEERHESSAGS